MAELVLGVNTIRIVRIIRGWSQRELAEASGIPAWRVWRLEQGISPPRPDEIQKIWTALSTGGAEFPRRGEE